MLEYSRTHLSSATVRLMLFTLSSQVRTLLEPIFCYIFFFMLHFFGTCLICLILLLLKQNLKWLYFFFMLHFFGRWLICLILLLLKQSLKWFWENGHALILHLTCIIGTSEPCSCLYKDVYYHLVEIVWIFYGMFIEPNYDALCICAIFWPMFPIIEIFVGLVKHNC